MLAAAGSANGASREVFRIAPSNRWLLLASPYVIREVLHNLPKLSPSAAADWPALRARLLIVEDIVSVDRPAVFPAAKDRPVLFSALAWADALLTLDRGDFETLLGRDFYGLAILTPGELLMRERAAGRLG